MTGEAEDIMNIHALLYAWGHARDGADFEALQNCFCADARIDISWIKAPASEFIARSKVLIANRKPGAHQKHVFLSPLVRVNGSGTRAFSIIHVQLDNRDSMKGHEFDLQSWFRFFDFLKKEDDGQWRIFRRVAVYEKDRISAVDPRGAPAELFEGMDLSAFPSPTKYLSWWQASQGRNPRTDIVQCYSPEEAALKAEGFAWVG
ncbi:MAG: nuclear transport factor 2 family protein [Beijerinckiaceae bacterium]